MANKINARNIVLNMLIQTLEKQALSSRVLKESLSDKALSEKDRVFIRTLYTGVLKRLVLLDYNIDSYSNTPPDKIKPVIKNILRISVYQMFFMDSVPDRAAVSESLKLLELRRMNSLKGYVNGVLRNIQRQGLKKDMPDYVRACVPEWIYKKVSADRGREQADDFFALSLEKDEGFYVSLNTAVYSKEEILSQLKKDGTEFHSESSLAFKLFRPGREPEQSEAFKRGMIYIQSPNSMKTALIAEKLCTGKSDPLIIDVCAAPGGKSVNLAVIFPGAEIIARDKSEEKISLIKENILRMGLDNIKPEIWDACVFDEKYKEKADIVIADLPCSGLGVIDRKPDIKHRLKQEDISSLAALQREILTASSGYVKAGGILIYSTCTLTKEENEENARWFEKESGFKFIKEGQYTIFKGRADGFYAAAFKKD